MKTKTSNSFVVPKAQMKLLALIKDGSMLTVYTDLDTFQYKFCVVNETIRINHASMLRAIRKQLIRFNYQRLCFVLTKLGEKLINLGSELNHKSLIADARAIKDDDITRIIENE